MPTILAAIFTPLIPAISAFKRSELKRFFSVLVVALICVAVNVTIAVQNNRRYQHQIDQATQQAEDNKRRIAIEEDEKRDLQARLFQLTEQIRVSQQCTANPKSGKCAEVVGASFSRGATAEVHTNATATFTVHRAKPQTHQ